MKPGVGEQLAGLRRILEEGVAPAVCEEHAAAQLRAVCDTLVMLEERWHRVFPLLMQENDELCALLQEAGETLSEARSGPGPAALASRLGAAAAAQGRDEAPYPSFADLEARNRELRELLVETILTLGAAPPGPQTAALRGRIRSRLRLALDRALAAADGPRAGG